MATYLYNSYEDTYTGILDTLPHSTLGNGVIASSGIYIQGTGTNFTTQIRPYGFTTSYLFFKSNSGQSELRKIADIQDDTHLTLRTAFSTVLSGSAYYFVSPSQIEQLSYAILSGTVLVNGQSRIAGVSGGWDSKEIFVNPVAPIIIDATNGSAQVEIKY
jgi:hypothetical protein